MPENPVVRSTRGRMGALDTAPYQEALQRRRQPRLHNPNMLDPNGVKVSAMVTPEPSDDELVHLAQMGVTHCYAWVDEEQCNAADLTKLRMRVAEHGLTLWNAGCMRWAKNRDIILGTPQRELAISGFQAMLRSLAAAGVTITTFTWEPDGVWSTQEATTRGGGQTRSADAALLAEHASIEEGRRRYGREYSETELWTNLEVFLGKVLPVAEQVGVRLSLHPNDPPVHSIAGVPCLITSKAAYDRAFALANHSPMLGMEFCVGCWLEGGRLTDASDYHPGFGDIVSAIAEFVEKINIVHFRNITQPLPKFDETFLDDGYGDMYCIMRALVAAGYTGSIILDHTPSFVPSAGGHAGASSYAIGFIKGALRAAQFELARCARL